MNRVEKFGLLLFVIGLIGLQQYSTYYYFDLPVVAVAEIKWSNFALVAGFSVVGGLLWVFGDALSGYLPTAGRRRSSSLLRSGSGYGTGYGYGTGLRWTLREIDESDWEHRKVQLKGGTR